MNENFKILKKKKFIDRVFDKMSIESKNIDTKKFEKVKSLNNFAFNKTLISNAKIIIVGTLTPPEGMNNGYYYSSSKNKVFGILDKCLDSENKLSKLKKELYLNPKNKDIINSIEKLLFDYKIAFIDIIDNAIRIKNSSKDDDILMFSLDKKSFEYCNTNQIFICTSKNAKDGLMEISQDKKVNIECSKIFVCHQDRFHFKLENWKDKLNLINN